MVVPGGTGTDPEMQEVTLSFLHPRGPSRSFVYPHKADILTVHISDILTLVEPTTYTGRTYWQWKDSVTRALENHRWWRGLCVCLCVHVCKGRAGEVCILYSLYACVCEMLFVSPATLGLSGYDKWCQVRDILMAYQSINPCG